MKSKDLLLFFTSQGNATPPVPPILLGSATRFHEVYGDNISSDTATVNANGWCLSAQGGYANRLGVAKNTTISNYANTSINITDAVKQMYDNASFPHLQSMSVMVGLNDIRLGQGVTVDNMLPGGLISMLGLHYGKTFTSINDYFSQGVSNAWSVFSGLYSKSVSTIKSSQIGDTLTRTFNGDAVVISSYVTNTNTRGFEVRVDGNLEFSFDPSGKCSSLGQLYSGSYFSPYGFILSGYGLGVHTIEIKVVAGTGTSDVIFDYITELKGFNSSIAQPFIWIDIPYLRNDAYSANSPFNQATQSGIQTLNTLIWTSVSYFTSYSKFGRVQINGFYDPNDPSQVSSDGIHPNCTGFQNISDPVGLTIDSFVAPTIQTTLQTWLNSLSGAQPSTNLKNSLNDFIYILNLTSQTAEHDFLLLIAGLETDEQRMLPFITTGVSPCVNNGTTLSTNGSTGNGSSTYLNYKWKALSHGIKFKQNDACIYGFNRDNTINAGFDFGSWDSGNKAIILEATTTALSASLNAPLYSFGDFIPSASGLFSLKRSASNVSKDYYNTTEISTSSAVSFALNDFEIYGNALNNSGSASFFAPHTQGLIGTGSSLINENVINAVWYEFKKQRGF